MNDQLIEVELESMAYGGSSLGHAGEQVVIVPYTIPGEKIQARVIGQKGRTLFAEGVTLLESSTDRVFPRCPHFGPNKCGSCQWQQLSRIINMLPLTVAALVRTKMRTARKNTICRGL